MVNHKKIASLAEEGGVIQKKLADEVGVSEAMMSYILRGVEMPSVSMFIRLADVLESVIDALINEANAANKK